MKTKKPLFLACALFAAVSLRAQSIDSIMALHPKEGLWYALEYYEVLEPHIVYAQAVLETGWFKSRLAKKGNLFGLYDSNLHRFRIYNHWIESVREYRDSVQNKYKGGDYLLFLERLPYAEDSLYCKKVKAIAEQLIEYE